MPKPIVSLGLICAAVVALATAPSASRAAIVGADPCAAANEPAACSPSALTRPAVSTVAACIPGETGAVAPRVAPRHRRRTMIGAANALHTGVLAHRRAHHHGRGTHPAVRATLAPATSYVAFPLPLPLPRPLRHPARAHAALPHVAAKLHRAGSRGGTPYALGNASPSVGLGARSAAMAQLCNDRVSDPASGWMTGRSPPRGDPLTASASSASPRRARRSSFARPTTLPVLFTSSLPSRCSGAPASDVFRAPLLVHSRSTVPPRAGRSGQSCPRWRCLR